MQFPALKGMIDELPDRGRWSKRNRALWLDAFTVVLDTFVVVDDSAPVPANPVDDHEPETGTVTEYAGLFKKGASVFIRPGNLSETWEPCVVIENAIDHSNDQEPMCLVTLPTGRQLWAYESQLALEMPAPPE